ncbi:MAG: GNAT family N-acetyltransferase [Chloroflexales bacterium]|nr:GNAT family N-acetyltransferase [Chloroflexales bacterium]
MVVATAKRLFLRHVHILDSEPLYRVFGDAEVMRFGDGVQTHDWVRAWVGRCLAQYQQWGFGPYVVVEQQRRELIGYCGLFYFPDVNGQPEVELGYRLARSTWGQGYGTEAAQAVRNYAFNVLCLSRLIAMIDPQNTASLRVAEKIGMRYETEVMFAGYTRPDHVYVIARS